MKQIKFRGRSLINDKWVCGDSIKHTENASENGIEVLTYIGERVPNARKVGAMKWVPVDPSTIGQFTGLKAEDDEELYEGDIVEICRFDHNGTDHHYSAYVDFYMGEFILCVTHRIFYQMINNELHKTFSKYKEKEAAPCWSLSEMYIGCCYSDGTIGNCEDIKIVGNIHEQSKG